MKLTDAITQAILDLLQEENGVAEIQRREFAEQIGCVPSQINYVLTSRFTPENGYLVESRRGGGGYIRIIQVQTSPHNLLMHVVNSIGTAIDAASCRAILENLLYQEVLDKRMANTIFAALSDRALADIALPLRDTVRASLFKQMLLTQL